MTVEEPDDSITKKRFSQPPLNLLFNPSLIDKQDVWKIDIVKLLETLLELLALSGNRDLRVCGVAILTSTLIHRLKVESIFRLDKIANQKEGNVEKKNEEKKAPIPELASLSLPYRKETLSPATLEELLLILENMITELSKPTARKNLMELEPVETVDFQEYLIKFEQVIEEYQSKLYDKVFHEKEMVFNDFVNHMDELEMARYFIAMLYLAMRGKIDICYGNPEEIGSSEDKALGLADSDDIYGDNGDNIPSHSNTALIKMTVLNN